VKCPRCQHENRSGAKFCEECAIPLARTCSNCGGQLSTTAKFCPECAHPVAGLTPGGRFAAPESYTPKHLAEKILTSKSALEGERKQVTVMFADLKGSMELLADRYPEEARTILDPVLERMMVKPQRRPFYCFCGFASNKSFTIGTMTGMRSISVTCVVLGNMANLDAERGRKSP
jgi:hypothetical protein